LTGIAILLRQKFTYTPSQYWQETVSCAIEQALRISPTNLPEATNDKRVEKLLKVSEEKGAYNVSRSIQPTPEQEKNTKKAAEIGLLEVPGYCPGSQYVYPGGASYGDVVGRAAHCP
jgi:hypothetical protein